MKRHAFCSLLAAIMLLPSTSFAQSKTELTARGIIRASIETVISTELVAVVNALPFKTGEAFATGDILVSFDCARYVAERRASEAELETARLDVISNEKLLRHKAIGTVEVDISRAKQRQMAARLEALAVRERQCVIKAPFAGHVVERQIQPFEMSKPNGPLLRLVNRELEVHLIVPSSWLNWLRIGTRFSFRVDETGTTLESRVARINAVVDPISRTVRVVSAVAVRSDASRDASGAGAVSPGMSGAAHFTQPEH